jgi:hypothetical protein
LMLGRMVESSDTGRSMAYARGQTAAMRTVRQKIMGDSVGCVNRMLPGADRGR